MVKSIKTWGTSDMRRVIRAGWLCKVRRSKALTSRRFHLLTLQLQVNHIRLHVFNRDFQRRFRGIGIASGQ